MTYDVVIIGSGSAGFSAAQAAREAGASVCLVEKERLGGECPNWACVPTKALLKTVKVWRLLRRAREFGITTSGMQIDFAQALAYGHGVVETITGGGKVGDRYVRLAEKLKIKIEFGEGSFEDAHILRVKNADGERMVCGKTFVIATGTEPFVPPIDGIVDVRFLTFKDVLSLRQLPSSIAIIGGGPVGCEFATFFSGLGTRVTLIQAAPRLLHREDPAIADLAGQAMAEREVEVLVNATTKRVWAARGGVHGLEVVVGKERQIVAVEQILVAAGKRAAVDGLGLAKAHVFFDERQNIKKDASGRTSQKHVFAAGDVAGGYLFTHTAHHEGLVAGHNAARMARGLRGPLHRIDERVVPRVTFVDPEVASVGMTQAEAKEVYKKVLVGEAKIATLSRAVTESARFGLLKIVADGKTGRVVGGHMIGESAGEVIHELALAIYLKAKISDLAGMIHAFPTFAEAVTVAAHAARKV